MDSTNTNPPEVDSCRDHEARNTPRGPNPLANLYVSMLQRLGIETDRFASGTGPMRGPELA